MESADWKLKLRAILHDPPDKIKSIEEHERKGDELFKKILSENVVVDDEKIKDADKIASAQSRVIVSPSNLPEQKAEAFKEASQISFEECKFIDIFTGNIEEVQTPNTQKVEKVMEALGNLSGFKDADERAKIAFLFLWRFYPEIFPEINKHPADSRAPNHSIYDHLVQTAAVASALPCPAFLLFTIAPVQSFISKARKTSDLWAGSYMLSYLIWESMKSLVEEFGPDVIIYPNLLGQPLVDRWLYFEIFKKSPFTKFDEPRFKEWFEKWENKDKDIEQKLTIANLPNRFLAVIPYDKNLSQNCEKAFKEKLKNLAQKVYEKVKDFSQNQNLQKDIEKHLLSYFQVYWVIMPWSNSGILPSDALSSYKELFSDKSELYRTIEQIVNHPYYKPANFGAAYSLLLELTEKLLGARKSVRDFGHIEQPGEKCHLCGEFKVLDIDDWGKLTQKIVKEGERLCGVCLTKRLFPDIIKDEFRLPQEAVKFPSTSEMASIGEKRRLDESTKLRFSQKFSAFKQKAGILGSVSVPKLGDKDSLYEIDGEYLMEETYSVDDFKKENNKSITEQDYQDILKFLRENKINPSRYYAILQMDGDNMGKWLKGEFNPKIGDVIHEKPRAALIQFSEGEDKKELQQILCAQHPNSPSIHQVFSRKLSQFALEDVRKIVENQHYGKLIYAGGDDVLAFLPVEDVLKCAYELQKSFSSTLSQKASMSAGILIVHHKYPLYLALKKVNEAEKKAKNKYGKNGFCLVFLTHSGEERECGGKWHLVDFIDELICKFRADEIPGVFPYQYLEVVEQLYKKKEKGEGENIPTINEILRDELERIFMKKQGEKERLKEYFEKSILPQFNKLDIENFASMLVVARRISTEVRV